MTRRRHRRSPVRTRRAQGMPLACACLFALFVAGCQDDLQPPPAGLPEVTVVPAIVKDIPIEEDFVGRVVAFRSVEVRTQVEGLLVRRAFMEGTDVKKGALLFEIDPRPLAAALGEAKARLARSEVVLDRARQKVARLKPLAEANAISREDYDEAVAAEKEAGAELQAGQATVEHARLNLDYTRITAPESGRIGRALVPEGRLVGKDGPTHLATIDKIDPIYVTFTVTDKEALLLDKAAVSGKAKLLDDSKIPVRLKLPDDSEYAAMGKLDFASSTINPETGTFAVRAEFPNRKQQLAPGMFVRVHVEVGQWPKAVLVPQRAVLKAPKGHYVYVVGKNNAVERRNVQVGDWFESSWIIEKGVAAGDPVVVDGLQALTPGATVKPVPVDQAPARSAAADVPDKQSGAK